MKVLKFGGSSVGCIETLRHLKQIVESASTDCVVVVSALQGVTDRLILLANTALQADDSYLDIYRSIVERHHGLLADLHLPPAAHAVLLHELDALLEELRTIVYGVHLIKDLSPKTLAAIVSYGERLSSRLVTALIDRAQWVDATSFIHTRQHHGKQVLANQETGLHICETLQNKHGIIVCGGFISSDIHTGELTNLGRGGSDYTASLIAAALNAEELQIWTDVDGFMTADPRVIPSAYTIHELSYTEAAELCNFGAKVIYPPTIYPVCIKNIPIRILNTLHPEHQGTLIRQQSSTATEHSRSTIKGISSITGTALITISGMSMVGVSGVSKRVFAALADAGVSVFLVSQASSENTITIGLQEQDCDIAVEVLNEEFDKEISLGSMYPMHAEKDLATVAIVGDNMCNTPGIAGKLFGTLGRSGISVIACAQGASETNISFVVRHAMLQKAMSVLHDSFFLSENKVLNVFICGVGTVGGQLIDQLHSQYDRLLRERHLQLHVVGIANSRAALINQDGVDLTHWRDDLKQAPACDAKQMLRAITTMNLYNSVFVDCTASAEVADMYLPLLENNVSVVAANKIAASSDYAVYKSLKETALRKGVKFLFETNVGAGLPIIGTINDLMNSGDHIEKIQAVLSGTLNFIFNEISASVPFSETIRRAKEYGYSEPDPRIDLSGKDVIRKLVILTREAGFAVEQAEVEKHLFVPESYFEGSIDDFWRRLPELDASFEQQRQALEAQHKRWRFVATMEQGKTKVELMAVDDKHPFYYLEGSNNIVLLTTERYHDYPMMIQGYGAGAGVTAAGVFANIMSIANI